ncbi:hypothetical protein F9802_02300 [Bacillus aerolatus]|uniref:Uncharacterized protein n=1 Tax=Bacillus aerolatus TaxID=2653354 RepID=A0A6I1FK64_9BACI|nr:hypothetical protein [Bacillus aerolatus]KAB7708990.1 hypothetical protein F9802_02300 [Bacillus aerolatus]
MHKEKRKRPFRLGRRKTDRRSGALCHTGVTAYVRESGRCSWTRKAEASVLPRQANVLPQRSPFFDFIGEGYLTSRGKALQLDKKKSGSACPAPTTISGITNVEKN